MDSHLKASITMYSFAIAAFFAYQATPAIPAEFLLDSQAIALKKLQPALTKERARALARIFVQTSQRPDCEMPWEILASISFNESSLGLYTLNQKTGDYSLMQINDRTMRRLGVSMARVKTDVTYAVEVSCRILRSNRNAYSKTREYWLGIYRSGTRFSSKAIVENAKAYSKIVLRTAATLGYAPVPQIAAAY